MTSLPTPSDMLPTPPVPSLSPHSYAGPRGLSDVSDTLGDGTMVAVLDIRNPAGTVQRRVWRRFARRSKAERWVMERLAGHLDRGVPADWMLPVVLPERQAARVTTAAGGPAFPRGL